MAKVKSFFNTLLLKIRKFPSNSKEFMKTDKGHNVLASLTCIFFGLVIGLVFLLIVEPTYGFQAFGEILSGGFVLSSATGVAIANTAALILVGLSVAFAYKCGLFNIGVAGQYLMGILGSLSTALLFGWHWFFCLIAGAVLGALWGAIPGLLKIFCNVNEVITSIMTNWIALLLVNDIIFNSKMYDPSKTSTYYVSGISKISDWFGLSSTFSTQSVTNAIFIAIFIAIGIHVLINKTKFGFELKACGLNKDSAKYAGINYKKNVVMSMCIAGALAGIGAGLYYLSNVGQFNPNNSYVLPAMGFDGISVALIAALNPIGTIFSALLLAFISRGSSTINTSYFPPEMANLIFGIIIYLCAFSSFFKTKIIKILNKEKTVKTIPGNKEIISEELIVLKEVEDALYLKEVTDEDVNTKKGGEVK